MSNFDIDADMEKMLWVHQVVDHPREGNLELWFDSLNAKKLDYGVIRSAGRLNLFRCTLVFFASVSSPIFYRSLLSILQRFLS